MADDADKFPLVHAQIKIFDNDRGTLRGVVAFAKLGKLEKTFVHH